MDIYGKLSQGVSDINHNPLFVAPTGFYYPENLKGKVLDTYKNLEWLLNHFKTEIKYNLMTRRREINIPSHYFFKDDIENSSLGRINYLATLNGMPTKQLDKHLDALAFEKPYHPIVECLKDNPWDKIERLETFIKTITTTNDALSHPIIKTWMIAAIAAAHSQNGFINQGVLVLQGKQNIGKTRWAKSLDPIDCGAVKEGALLDPNNKDNVILLARHWIVELGEVDATFRKTDIARLKSFITMQADDVRFPYAAKDTHLVRRTSYIATVNDENFLADDTGNRRWWTITVQNIDFTHGLDMQQVWAEAYTIWQAGALTYLSTDLQNSVNEANVTHEKVDPFKEKLNTHYDWESTARHWMNATQILEELGYSRPSRGDSTRMGNYLRIFAKGDERIRDGYRLYNVPYFIIKNNNSSS